jgi:putative DNA primase/helicase
VQGASIIGPGPGHSAKDASLIITPSVTAPDGFLAHSYCGDDALECKDFVRSQLGLPQFKPSEPQAAMTPRLDALETPNKNIEPARRIWRESGPLIGGIAERYLNSRKLALDPAEDWHRVLRFHPNCPFGEERAPAMIALMRDILTDEPSCIQRTRLTPDGIKIDRQMLGPANRRSRSMPMQTLRKGLSSAKAPRHA